MSEGGAPDGLTYAKYEVVKLRRDHEKLWSCRLSICDFENARRLEPSSSSRLIAMAIARDAINFRAHRAQAQTPISEARRYNALTSAEWRK